ncbi:hypothetical protein I7I51_05160 [Histoplasma capsulatum]|uniref:Uncharacterized protein n=1 Tax=Ajellomyces capsulatus TaxID=5037 RepID=A0A8A1M7B3_AJECA|nr:hypothetical protein I7I51_05160 [Histoplasma capsulatum]
MYYIVGGLGWVIRTLYTTTALVVIELFCPSGVIGYEPGGSPQLCLRTPAISDGYWFASCLSLLFPYFPKPSHHIEFACQSPKPENTSQKNQC